MERLLFNTELFEKLYSCKNLSQSEWNSYRNPNFGIGMLYLVPGVLYFLLYIPFLIAMLKKQFFKHSCYKLMFLLGILDIFGIIFSGILTGILTIQGEIFCIHQTFNYVIGCLSTGVWTAMCLTCIILAINRSLDLIYPQIKSKLFEGNRCFFWYFPPLFWGFYFVAFEIPHIFFSRGLAFFFQPYFNISNSKLKLDEASWNQRHRIHSINNSIVIVLLPLIYAFMCAFFFIKTRNKTAKILITKMQKLLFIQAFLLCSITVTAAIVYVSINYLPSPPIFLSILAQFTWQSSHGAAVIIYLLLNKSLRKATFGLFFRETSVFPLTKTRYSKKQIPVLKVTVH